MQIDDLLSTLLFMRDISVFQLHPKPRTGFIKDATQLLVSHKMASLLCVLLSAMSTESRGSGSSEQAGISFVAV